MTERLSLLELDAAFIKITHLDGARWTYRDDAQFADCDGVSFLCPLCFLANNGSVGTHAVICWKPHIAQDITPGPGRWSHTGSSIRDLSLVAGSSSIALTGGCAWHGSVQNGYAHTDLGPERVAAVRAMYPRPSTMTGRRVPGFDWHLWEAGDYGYCIEDGAWIGITPNGLAANLGNHEVGEREDGTITVSPSIECWARPTKEEARAAAGAYWHGYLEAGVWREC